MYLCMVECDVCGEEFESKAGLNSHKGWMHPEEMRVTVECAWCGEEKEMRKGRYERIERPFCDQDCKGKWRSENLTEDNHWLYERIELECDECGCEFERKPSRVNSGDNFCSMECRARNLERGGETNPNYSEKETTICEICEESFSHKPSADRVTCSLECAKEYFSQVHSGENHYNWQGGAPDYYGSNWKRQRRKARKRDGHTCQECGESENLHVHHKKPISEFEAPEDANELANLVTLCESCHIERHK